MFIRDLEPNDRLARDDLHDADTDSGKGTCNILGQVAYLADLYPHAEIEFKTRNDRSRVNGHHLDLDIEIQ